MHVHVDVDYSIIFHSVHDWHCLMYVGGNAGGSVLHGAIGVVRLCL